MVKLSATQQRNAVSEGAALGLLLNGRSRLPASKTKVDLAFVGAWRQWEYAGRFPQVTTDVGKGLDGIHALTRADERKRTFALYWEVGRELVIHLRPTFTIEAEPDFYDMILYVDGDVPLEGWATLAREFLTRLDR